MKLDILDQKTAASMATHSVGWGGCTKCTIGQIAHTHVFARGTLPCQLLFVGEAPGKTEDVTGWPFIGRSGKLLDEWIARAWERVRTRKMDGIAETAGGLRKGNALFAMPPYAITNIVLCRPCDRPGGPNRPPSIQEALNCKPRFEEFVTGVARPKAIVTIGRSADVYRARTLLPTTTVVHPAYVLRLSQRSAARQTENVLKVLSEFMLKEFYGG